MKTKEFSDKQPTNIKGISVGEFLRRTYDKLIERNKPIEIIFSQRVLTEIADDSDWHRTRKGYMAYERAGLFDFNGKVWIIGSGHATGDYPAEKFDSDILAIASETSLKGESKTKIQSKLIEAISDSEYGRNTLILGMHGGELHTVTNNLSERLGEILRPKIGEFRLNGAEYDEDLILLSTLSPICKKAASYKTEGADSLAEGIESVLK